MYATHKFYPIELYPLANKANIDNIPAVGVEPTILSDTDFETDVFTSSTKRECLKYERQT